MPAFFLALLAAALATAAGREAVRVARLTAALNAGAGLLAAAWVAAAVSSAVAAWFGAELGRGLTPTAKGLLLAGALLVGAAELLVLHPPPAPREATRSLGAIFLVMLGGQLTDAARLFVMALAAAGGSALLSAAGAAAGSGVVATFAWALAGEWETRLPLRAVRWGAATLLLLAALASGLTALGLVG